MAAMVTIKTISEQCGVSVAAVSKALNGQPGVSSEKAELVRRTARELGYFPNIAARTLKTNRSYNIGIVFQNQLAHEFFSIVLESVRDELSAAGYDITLLGERPGREDGIYNRARQRQCDGVLIVQAGWDEKRIAEAKELAEGDIPVVSIDSVYSGCTAVVNDNVGSMQEIIRYLHGLGHTRIAFIHGENYEVTRQRLAGFYRGCRDCGIPAPEEFVIPAHYHEPRDSGRAARKLMSLETRPTCILFPDDVSCLGGLTAIEALGLSVPDDVSCFGYDGIRMAGVLRPSLATYSQNALEIGKEAVRQLLSAIEDPKCYVPQTVTVTGAIQPGGTVRDLTGVGAHT